VYAARWRLNRTLAVWLFSLWLAQIAAAQSATVRKDVNLRADSTTSSAVIELLKPAATLKLLDSAKQSGFYHVKAEDGKEGWVWTRNISVENAPSSSTGTGATTEELDRYICDVLVAATHTARNVLFAKVRLGNEQRENERTNGDQ
jgi:uncharacterized protein YgiM (DUF1202 family)